jgi:hypothetical protein
MDTEKNKVSILFAEHIQPPKAGSDGSHCIMRGDSTIVSDCGVSASGSPFNLKDTEDTAREAATEEEGLRTQYPKSVTGDSGLGTSRTRKAAGGAAHTAPAE